MNNLSNYIDTLESVIRGAILDTEGKINVEAVKWCKTIVCDIKQIICHKYTKTKSEFGLACLHRINDIVDGCHTKYDILRLINSLRLWSFIVN